jgi:chemotaxis protein MotB
MKEGFLNQTIYFMKTKQFLLLAGTVATLFSCALPPQNAFAESKKLKKAHRTVAELETENKVCGDSAAARLATVKALYSQIAQFKSINNQLSGQLSDQKTSNENLSAITGTQAESIKRSFASIEAKDAYIRDLQAEIARRDATTNDLVKNLKSAIGSLDQKDISVKLDRNVIYIDISDKMLFKTGKYQVTDQAKEVLGKVATVLLAHPDIDFMVEGHTDNVPYHEGVLTDNWDLSTKRATSVIRILQNEYKMQPERMTAAGRGEYIPVADNTIAEGKASNRRTRIVILPQMDKLYQILDKNKKE